MLATFPETTKHTKIRKVHPSLSGNLQGYLFSRKNAKKLIAFYDFSLPCKDQVTRQKTVKWSIVAVAICRTGEIHTRTRAREILIPSLCEESSRNFSRARVYVLPYPQIAIKPAVDVAERHMFLASEILSSIMPYKGQTTNSVFYFIHYNKDFFYG